MTYSLYKTAVSPDWIDYNGHMNAGFYNVVIDKAAEQLIADMDGIAYFKKTSGTFYSVEIHIIYANELKLGDPIEVKTQIISFDRKRVHLFSTLYHGQDGYEAASGETMMLHYVQNEGAVVPMPDEFFANVEKMARQHANLEVPEAIGRSVRLAKQTLIG
ncbi:MAG: thioesterase family protein [Chloroflexota bacterium]